MPRTTLFGYILIVATGCAHWEADTRPVPEVVSEDPNKIMITRHDSSTVILVEPTVLDSQVTGLRGTVRGRVDKDSTVAIPLNDVAHLYRWDPGSTTLAYVLGIGVAVLFVTGLWTLALGTGA